MQREPQQGTKTNITVPSARNYKKSFFVVRRHLDDVKKYVPEFVPEFIPEFIPEFVPEFDLNTDFYLGTNSGMNSGMNFFMSSKWRLISDLLFLSYDEQDS